MDKRKLLTAIESFFGGAPQEQLARVTVATGRSFTVLSCLDAPSDGWVTHALLEGPLAEWPDVRSDVRLLPICIAASTEGGAPSWLAHVYDWCLSKAVAPRPKELVPTLGVSEALPHVRMDDAFPWQDGESRIDIDGVRVVPILMYPVTDAEGRLQHEEGAQALDDELERRQVVVFAWNDCDRTS